jgi:hypothetical protein
MREPRTIGASLCAAPDKGLAHARSLQLNAWSLLGTHEFLAWCESVGDLAPAEAGRKQAVNQEV